MLDIKGLWAYNKDTRKTKNKEETNMRDYEEYDFDEAEDLRREEYEERKRRREEEENTPAWTEAYLSTLGMSMRDFL